MNLSSTVQIGLIYSILALGIYVSFRIMNTPDLTVDGSFTTGMAISAVFTIAGHPLLGLLVSLMAGAGAGAVTGLLQTKCGIHPLLAGILTMTGLYSINLAIMGGSPNLTLLSSETAFTYARAALPALSKDAASLITALFFCALSAAALIWFFKTCAGLNMRAAGDNEVMVRASSINADAVKTGALAISNAFVAFSGAILAQYQNFADINAGTGIIVVGLASVIIGGAIIRGTTPAIGFLAAAAGAIIYRILIAAALWADFFPAYMLRLVSAVIVGITLAAPNLKKIAAQAGVKTGNSKNA